MQRSVRPWLAVLSAAACTSSPPAPVVHAFRLLPGQDLLAGIQRFAEQHDLQAACVATCVGSVTRWSLRFADRPDGTEGQGPCEILGLCGTVSRHGSHLHLALADGDGRAFGGHLLVGCRVYTTAEIVLLESPAHVFTRAQDGSTPWAELQVGWRR